MAKKMEAGQTQTLKKVLHYMKPYRFFLLLSVFLSSKLSFFFSLCLSY